jgi:hypothetical protein
VDKAEKKALRAKAKAAMREQADSEWDEYMVLEPAQLKALLDHLDESFPRAGCDHTLRLTRAWALDHDVDPDTLEKSVAHFGGFCDCEVLANVDPDTQVDGWPRYMREVAQP